MYCNEYLFSFKLFNLSPEVDFETVKNTYRKLVLKYHPDKNKSPKSELKFKKIQQAYNYLVDFYKNPVNESDVINSCAKYVTPWGHKFENLEEYEKCLNIFLINLDKIKDIKLRMDVKKIIAANLTDYHKYRLKKIISIILISSIKVKEWIVSTLFNKISYDKLEYLVPAA